MFGQVMGIVNVTPDSFSDGGLWLDTDAAVAHGRRLFAEGAAIVDVGGESTRPGALAVSIDEECARVVPVVKALASEGRVSIDTRHGEVAEAALSAGATILNDVSASLGTVAGCHRATYIAMHMQGEPQTMQTAPRYDDVVEDVFAYLVAAARQAQADGAHEVLIDPGFGFGKTLEHNVTLLAGLRRFTEAGFGLAVGMSRKGFLGTLSAGPGGEVPPPTERVGASVAAATVALMAGAELVRVHDVAATVQAARLVAAVRERQTLDANSAFTAGGWS